MQSEAEAATPAKASASSLETPAPAAVTPSSSAKKKMKPLVTKNSITINNEVQEKASKIADKLEEIIGPNPPIPLNHSSGFQLLVAVILSAQTTDLKVNECTPSLFELAPDALTMSKLSPQQVEGHIRTLGLAPTKAKNLVGMSKMLVDLHRGAVPSTFEELEALPGVGHKTASVVMSQVHNKSSFPVDTHIHRLAQRWGLTKVGGTVEQTEADLKVLFPEEKWRDAHLQIIYFGREHCPAKQHDPKVCPICSWAAVDPFRSGGVSPPRPGEKGTKKSK
jgi:endonuclease-3